MLVEKQVTMLFEKIAVNSPEKIIGHLKKVGGA